MPILHPCPWTLMHPLQPRNPRIIFCTLDTDCCQTQDDTDCECILFFIDNQRILPSRWFCSLYSHWLSLSPKNYTYNQTPSQPLPTTFPTHFIIYTAEQPHLLSLFRSLPTSNYSFWLILTILALVAIKPWYTQACECIYTIHTNTVVLAWVVGCTVINIYKQITQ